MKVARWSFGVVVALGLSLFVGCSSEQAPTAPDALSQSPPGETGQPGTEVEEGSNQPGMNKYWGDNIVSEAFYALSQSRSGGSSKKYKDSNNNVWTMADWNWAKTDRDADGHVSRYIGCEDKWDDNCWSCNYYRGKTGKKNGYYRGGECKFFANLVLYRSSYGWGDGKHLAIPHLYSYANRSVRDADKGWVIQAPQYPGKDYGQHTAIVVHKYPGGLDVVDSNFTGPGEHYIARHFMSWSDLSRFKAWCPWENPRYIDESDPTSRCY